MSLVPSWVFAGEIATTPGRDGIVMLYSGSVFCDLGHQGLRTALLVSDGFPSIDLLPGPWNMRFVPSSVLPISPCDCDGRNPRVHGRSVRGSARYRRGRLLSLTIVYFALRE
jgi:hypothetical protein